jgi:hypothetical protein
MKGLKVNVSIGNQGYKILNRLKINCIICVITHRQ